MKTLLSVLLLWQGWASSARAAGCEYKKPIQDGLPVADGYVEFMPASQLAPLKAALPAVASAEVDSILKSPRTIWYDEESMVFLYQDSIEVVVGARANCVGRQIGENNPGNPGIHKLVDYFGPDYRFRFPFRKAAGTDETENVRVINFWSVPQAGGKALPVRYWKLSSRGRWAWVFPVGTVFGEVLYQQGPDGRWYVFEIRTRKRHAGGWAVDLFRPFPTAASLAEAVKVLRPQWQTSSNLSRFVKHLSDKNTLVAHRMESQAYGKVFPPIDGALDYLPGVDDSALVVELLTKYPFVSTEGAIWKENGRLETYAPSSQAGFSVVPKNYRMGMIPVNEVSCNRCHSETGRRLYHFDFDIQLYGEIWGEDRIFTWHLFQPSDRIFGPWDDTQGSRKPNPRLVKAKLIQQGKPSASEAFYKPLPSAFVPE